MSGLAAGEHDRVLMFGHTHKPWIREYRGVLFVNCGSVGKPKDGDQRAGFAILTASGDQIEARIERVPYDAETVARPGRRSRAPRRVRRQAAARRLSSAKRIDDLDDTVAEKTLRGVARLGIPRRDCDRLPDRRSPRLSPNDVGLQLLENAAATALGLFAIILMFGPVSGGYCNLVVSLIDASFGGPVLARRARLHSGADRRVPASARCSRATGCSPCRS